MTGSSDDIVERIDALRQDVHQAQAEAATRAGPPETGGPVASRPADGSPALGRKALPLLLIGGGTVLVGTAVVGGVLASSGGGHRAKADPVDAYLAEHAPSGTPVAVVGQVNTSLPATYPTVPIKASDPRSAANLQYTLAPDPISSAGSALAAYVQGRSTLVAVDPGRASLWAVSASGGAGVSSTVSLPTSTVPPTTPPPPAPTTAAPTTTAPTTTAPTTTAPATTPTTTGRQNLPSNIPPNAGTVPSFIVVIPGQSMWSIAEAVVARRLGAPAGPAQVGRYWASLVWANSGNLPVAGNPNLIFSGTRLLLPPLR